MALWVRGRTRAGAGHRAAVAVVGSRAATGYGMHVAGEFGAGLAAGGATVVSGAAIGIDGSAHRGALAAEGPTIAVLACGIDRAYPAAHATLLERIARDRPRRQRVPAGQRPRPAPLPRPEPPDRGAGWRDARRRGGCAQRGTAHRGRRSALGRPLMAVPGPITSGLSAGCHRLIREGALLVTRPAEVLEVVGSAGRGPGGRARRTGAAAPTDCAAPRPWCTTRCRSAGRGTCGGWPGRPACPLTTCVRRWASSSGEGWPGSVTGSGGSPSRPAGSPDRWRGPIVAFSFFCGSRGATTAACGVPRGRVSDHACLDHHRAGRARPARPPPAGTARQRPSSSGACWPRGRLTCRSQAGAHRPQVGGAGRMGSPRPLARPPRGGPCRRCRDPGRGGSGTDAGCAVRGVGVSLRRRACAAGAAR